MVIRGWSIKLDGLKFLFRVLAVCAMERHAPARKQLLNEKRALGPVASGH